MPFPLISFFILALINPTCSQLNAQLQAPSAFSALPLNQAVSFYACPAPHADPPNSPRDFSINCPIAWRSSRAYLLGGLNGQLQAIQQLQALQTLGGLGIGLNGLNGLGIPTNGATFIPLGQVLIPTGKEVSAKDICRSKGNDGGRNDDNMQMQNSNNGGGFCPPCGNFGCCPSGQYCEPCSQPCQQENNNFDQNQQQQQQFMMGNNGYNEGGQQRKRRRARRKVNILTMRKSFNNTPQTDRELTLFNYINF
uniref:Uncharacterized protein n=1 Tax=Meloidogyne enterolobii TaxID=390850 RepID=A0A6V7UFZ0_MELEN|nr:unnamed protein product [Meloidogyne enterolobii]